MARETDPPRVLRIETIEEARAAFKQLGVAEDGMTIMGPKAVFRVLKIYDVEGRAASILKQEMLSRGGEAAVSWHVYRLEPGKADVVLMGTLRQFEGLETKLARQPFGLREVGRQIKHALERYSARLPVLKAGRFELDLSRRTHIMGVVNVTPDSFSDAGLFVSTEAAVQGALRMVEQGADIIDVGGESTRPGSEPVSHEEELARVIPVIERLASQIGVPISIDTYKPEIAEQALQAGASIVNDVTGLADERMVKLVAEKSVSIIIMHMKGLPKTMQENPTYEDLMGEISQFFSERAAKALAAGLGYDKIMVDPGIGFGKTLEHNLEIMYRLSEFKSLGYPIVLGPSRKSFIGLALGGLPVDERLEGTAASVAYGIAQGANVVRVHDVKEMVRVAKMTDAILSSALP